MLREVGLWCAEFIISPLSTLNFNLHSLTPRRKGVMLIWLPIVTSLSSGQSRKRNRDGTILVRIASWTDPGFVEHWYPKRMPAAGRLTARSGALETLIA